MGLDGCGGGLRAVGAVSACAPHTWTRDHVTQLPGLLLLSMPHQAVNFGEELSRKILDYKFDEFLVLHIS